MESKKRKKVSRHHGSHTHGRGAKKKARGSGHRGGVGMAGTGKRADQKKTKIIGKGQRYFRKVIALRAPQREEVKSITLKSIQENIQNFVKKGIAKESSGGFNLDLKRFKIIGNTEVNMKLNIKAKSATPNAMEKIKGAGGSIEIEKQKGFVKESNSKKEVSEDNEED